MKTSTLTAKSLLLFFAVLFVFAIQAQYKLSDKIPVAPDVKIGKLANGLTYYIKKNAKPEKKVELRLIVNAGSILEDENQQGLAHFMEHMNFNGSKHFPKNELVNYLQTIGVKFGADLNASTGFDETIYILPIPAEKPEIVDKGFTVLEDWAGGALLTAEEINKERGVVMEELRLGKGANERMRQQYFPKLLNGSRYAERLPIGKAEIIQHGDPNLIRKFYHDWYRPDLMAVVVVGDIDPAVAEQKIKEHFSHLKNPTPQRPRPAITAIAPRIKEEAMSVNDKEATQTEVEIINYVKPSKTQITWADYTDELVKQLFSSMLNTRLQELTQKPNPPFMYAYSGFEGFIRGYDAFSSMAVTGKGDVKNTIEALVTELERVKKYGFTAAELQRAKADVLNNYEESLKEKGKTNSNQVLEEFIRNFLEKEPIPGIDAEAAFVKQELPNIKLDDVNALTKNMNAGQKEFVLVTGPDKRDVPVPSNSELLALVNNVSKTDIKPYEEKKIESSLMSQAPVGGKIISEAKDDDLGTTTLKLNNGVIVTLKPTNFKNDEILMDASRFGGSNPYTINNADDKYNAALASTLVMQMGIKDLSPTDLQKFLSGKTVQVSPQIGGTEEGFSGGSSVKDLETMLQLVYLYATQPRKDDELFTSFITKQKSFLSIIFQNPQYAFMDTLNKVLSQNNPRATGIPHEEDFAKVDENKILDIYKERFSNFDGMHFYFIGNFDINTIKPLVESYLGSLPATQAEHKYADLGIRPPKGVVNFTFNKGKDKKSLIRMSISGETKFDADESMLLQAACEVLQIKVIEKLREEMGGAYTASVGGSLSKIPYERYNINFSIPCGPENVDKLKAAAIMLIDSLKINGPSETDLNKVKETWKKKYEEDIKTNRYWLNNLSAAEVNGLDPKRILTYEKRVDAITIDDVKRVANKYFDLNNYVTGILMPAEEK